MTGNARGLLFGSLLALAGLSPDGAPSLVADAAFSAADGQARPPDAAKVDAIAQQFKGTHDIAGAAEALASAAGGAMTYGYGSNTSGIDRATTTQSLLDQRTMICYEFVHWAAFVAGNQATATSGVPRLGPSAGAAFMPRSYNVWDGASDIPRNQMVVFVARAYNNSAGYYHIGISLGGGKMIHFPASGGAQTVDITQYNNWLLFSEVRVSDYNWMSAQGDPYTQQNTTRDTSHTEVSLSDRADADNSDTYVYSLPAATSPPSAQLPSRNQLGFEPGEFTYSVDGKLIVAIDLSGRNEAAERSFQRQLDLGLGPSPFVSAPFNSTPTGMSEAATRPRYNNVQIDGAVSLTPDALAKASTLPASQGISILQSGNTQTVSSPGPVESPKGAWSLLPRLIAGPQHFVAGFHSQPLDWRRRPDDSFDRDQAKLALSTAHPANVKIFFTSTGRSSGAAMSMTVVNLGTSAVTVVGNAFLLEPVKMSPQDLRRELQRYPSTRQVTTTLNGYCFDFAKAPPMAGQVYRLASARAQADLEPLRYLAAAARRLGARGSLHADVNPGEYEQQLLQWAVWTAREHFNRAAYERAFVEHGRKNLEGAGRKWTKEIEAALQARATNRWPDIVQVLRLAAEIGR